MLARLPSTPRLLVVEHDAGIRELLLAFLTSEGYTVQLSTSPVEALALIDEQTFHLVLTDLFSTNAKDRFAFVDLLRVGAHPTPVGVLTGWNVAGEALTEHGLALLMPKPFEIEDLLTSIAAELNTPLGSEEVYQGQMLEQFIGLTGAAEWEGVAALCTEDVTFSLPGNSPFAGAISGKAALCAYLEAARTHFPDLRLEDVLVYHRPPGVSARYRMHWRGSNGSQGRLTAALLVEFAGKRIRRIGARVNDERLTALVTQAAKAIPLIEGTAAILPPRLLLGALDVVTRSSLAQVLSQEGSEVARSALSEEALVFLESPALWSSPP